MATDSNTLLDEAKCLGCASNSSTSDLLKLGILGRIASAYSAVQSFISRAGITDATQIAALLSLADSAVANGWWAKCDLIYPFVGGNATAHAQNLKSSNFTITWVGTVTHNANGITGNGVDGYGNTGYISANNSLVTLDSLHQSLYARTLGTNTARYYCGVGLTPREALQSGGTLPNVRFYGHDAGAINQGPIAVGFIMGSRTETARRHIFNQGTDFISNTVRSNVAVGAIPVFVMCLNNVGVPASFNNANFSGFTMGSGLTFAEYQLMATDWQTFQTALGRQV